MSRQITAATVRALPKVELHIHIEGSIPRETIVRMAQEAGVPLLRPLERLFTFTSLADFLETYEWWCDLLRTPDVAHAVAYDTAAMIGRDGVVYAEMLMGPKYWPHLPYVTVIPALAAGFDEAQADGHADCRIVPSIGRDQSPDWAMELVDWLGAQRPHRVVGIGIDGDEAVLGRTSPAFAQVFARAGELGLGRTAHAGESGGPESVRDVLDYLDVDRIDHGIRAIEDPDLVRRLAREQVTLNVCPTSNVISQGYAGMAEHPIGALLDAGVPVTVNSDDPGPLDITLTQELVDTADALDWDVADVVQATRTAIDAAFCPPADARALHATLDSFAGTTMH